ncbi:hypothetical protein Efla_007046 [Eimeria flavescens]
MKAMRPVVKLENDSSCGNRLPLERCDSFDLCSSSAVRIGSNGKRGSASRRHFPERDNHTKEAHALHTYTNLLQHNYQPRGKLATTAAAVLRAERKRLEQILDFDFDGFRRRAVSSHRLAVTEAAAAAAPKTAVTIVLQATSAAAAAAEGLLLLHRKLQSSHLLQQQHQSRWQQAGGAAAASLIAAATTAASVAAATAARTADAATAPPMAAAFKVSRRAGSAALVAASGFLMEGVMCLKMMSLGLRLLVTFQTDTALLLQHSQTSSKVGLLIPVIKPKRVGVRLLPFQQLCSFSFGCTTSCGSYSRKASA